MDGTYGNVFPTNSPMSTGTPSSTGGDAYKVNVSRQKTKKWAEFKPQNYDGDDWGADYDEGPEEPQPAPPPKPMGPRQPVAAPPPHLRQIHPPGSPPLHISTQHSPKIGQFETASPFASAPPATGSSIYSAGPGFGQGASAATPTSRHMSPAPQSAGPVPARFPPRKSSMGQYDAPDPAELARPSRPGSRPASGSGHKPWAAEPRSSSPASAKSPISPTKPLPFIRPADIYRRMEEEKEKERRSMESSRPSLDSVTGREIERVDSPKSQTEPTVQRRRGSLGAEQDAEINKPLRTSLAPVAERKSEYGLDGLLESYASPGPAPTTNIGTDPGLLFSGDQLAPQEELRRMSTSPKLPDLTRMSAFGEDLFSTALAFPSDAPPMPNVPDSSSHSSTNLTQSMASYEKPPAISEPAPMSKETEEPKQSLATPILQTGANFNKGQNTNMEPSAQASMEVSDDDGKAGAAPDPTESMPTQVHEPINASSDHSNSTPASLEVASNTQDQRPLRPSLPGGWVTETPETTGDIPGPRSDATPQPIARKAVDSGNVSPITETEDSAEDSSNAGITQQPLGSKARDEETTAATGENPQLSLPPLRTASPAVSASQHAAADQSQPVAENQAPSFGQNLESTEVATPVPTTAMTMHSDIMITPTAPLNPRRGPQEGYDIEESIVPPPTFEADTVSSSPVKDSDVLREEIMKSLSPVQASNDFLEATGRSTAAYHSTAGPVRESSYLGDVYGDYWADDKAEPELHMAESAAQKEIPMATATSGIAPTGPVSGPAKDVASASESVAEPEHALRRRFSWEAGESQEKVAPAAGPPHTEMQAEPKSLGPELHNVVVATATPPAPGIEQAAVSSPLDASHLAPAPKSEQLPQVPNQTVNARISHQVSQASTIPPRSTLDAPIEPPSPVSVLSERVGAPPENRRPSFAEEKTLMQTSSNPVSPTPPPEQHPAVAGVPQEPQPSERPPTPPPASAKREVNLMPFRHIMEMPSASERIKHYNETRKLFATIDTGLDEWTATMRSRRPEYANMDGSLRNALAMPAPYFQQQQNNGFSGELAEGGMPAATHHNMPMPPPQMHGHHHSGAQVGTKSKELFMAAGKAGKGLLSKGKNKLRGTGDKVFF
ncbi:hypothetical protein B0H66DRAFT_468130 [Apodospora peruviana]|uniref:Uncharacterized protein n=1 Tax=Apodospora peruviana TaxID=516989 RepID=A0AAE0IU26_9PEZI|nr:hypothetical protein B0H66DRAFT_468130 [Apodospora peruviana]